MSNFYANLRQKKEIKANGTTLPHEPKARANKGIAPPEEALPMVYFTNYLITNDGEIYNTITRRYMTRHVDKQGYLYVMLTDQKGRLCHKKVHIAVAEVYVPNPEGYPIVNHLDGNKQNPLYTNLEWDTFSGNTQHAYDTGLIQKSWKPLRRTHPKLGDRKDYKCVTEAVQDTPNATQSGISKVCNGKTKTHAGYYWEYI